MLTMRAYKLFRRLKNGEITSLFINKKRKLPLGEWLEAECHPTAGYTIRPSWHCTANPIAPHLSQKGRVWAEVEIEDYQELKRPESQGGLWYLAKRMRIVGIHKELECPTK